MEITEIRPLQKRPQHSREHLGVAEFLLSDLVIQPAGGARQNRVFLSLETIDYPMIGGFFRVTESRRKSDPGAVRFIIHRLFRDKTVIFKPYLQKVLKSEPPRVNEDLGI